MKSFLLGFVLSGLLATNALAQAKDTPPTKAGASKNAAANNPPVKNAPPTTGTNSGRTAETLKENSTREGPSMKLGAMRDGRPVGAIPIEK